ncbi:MAG: flagellar biosynthetic protein FliR [Burkholderiaceae bacterium]|jgi:flagellar biosynthetic protein FliR|nr:flagellar biosynthetic protein FliR [Burkholderiaceae bacterium]
MSFSLALTWLMATLLLTLRIAPVFAFAPPFTLLGMPVRVRVLLTLMLAACLVQLPGARATDFTGDLESFVPLAASELLIGLGVAFAFQAAFAALYFAGRVLDFQAGFGLALVIDPATRSQSPLLGTLLAMVGAAVFFAVDGHHDLLRVFAASLEAVPIGALASGWAPEAIIAHFGVVFALGLVIAGAAMLVLFLTDIALAFLMRTMPQMNVLLLGLQVKTVVLLLTLVAMSGLLLPAFLRVFESAIRFIGQLEP